MEMYTYSVGFLPGGYMWADGFVEAIRTAGDDARYEAFDMPVGPQIKSETNKQA